MEKPPRGLVVTLKPESVQPEMLGSLSAHIRKRGGNAHRFLCRVRKNYNNKGLD